MSDKPQKAVLRIDDRQVYCGEGHVLHGMSLVLGTGILSVVGHNGMKKFTLCNTIVGLKNARFGAIRVEGHEVEPQNIQHLGVAYVPQGRWVWPSLTVDEHLRLIAGNRSGASWTVQRVYAAFVRLAERRSNSGSQLSGDEQQMLAIARALLSDPRLLILDAPTEGLVPVIVSQIENMLKTLADEEEMAILVIEPNIGVVTTMSDRFAIMINGRLNRSMQADALAEECDLQQRLLGFGRHSDDAEPSETIAKATADLAQVYRMDRGEGAAYLPVTRLPNRWNILVADLRHPAKAAKDPVQQIFAIPYADRIGMTVLLAGTHDTKGREWHFMAHRLKSPGIACKTVDLLTFGKPVRADIPANLIASSHPCGLSYAMTGARAPLSPRRSKRFPYGFRANVASGGSFLPVALAGPASPRQSCGRCRSAYRKSWCPPSPLVTCRPVSVRRIS